MVKADRLSGTGLSRRRFVIDGMAGVAALTIAPTILAGCGTRQNGSAAGSPWDLSDKILARVKAPVFPARDFAVTEFGISQAGGGPATTAIQNAIDACHAAGGGRVVIPPGDFETAGLTLKSNVNLHVSEGATLRFSRNPEDYLPARFTRWEGVELMNYAPLVYAFEQENVALTGGGTLDGQADDANWWPWKGKTEYGWTEDQPEQAAARDRLFAQAEAGVPVPERVFGTGDYLRPNFVQFYGCRNVLIEGLTFVRSPMWVLHPVRSTNVTIRGVTVESHGPNNDGCDIESCTDVLVEDCLFDTGDDCVVVKSGRNADGRRLAIPAQNIVVRRCTMRDGHGGVVVGSEISGGAMNIFAEDCKMDSPNLERVLRIKTNSVRGGVISGIYARNIAARPVSDSVVRINFFYEEGDAGQFPPDVSEIVVENVECAGSDYGLYLRGYERSPIRGLTLRNCTFHDVRQGNVLEHVEDLEFDHVLINGEVLES